MSYYAQIFFKTILTQKRSFTPNQIFVQQPMRQFSAAKPDMIMMKEADEWDAYLESETPIIL